MGSTLGIIRLRTGSVEVLTYWVKEMVLTNIPKNPGIVMDNATFHKGKARQKMIKDVGTYLLIRLILSLLRNNGLTLNRYDVLHIL
ncbi:hypothetical protein [Holospora curviuscula]|uniref:Tc1-like transposase DDE domain-containing protein n=1 Tax=Holospora curviuscula TaxID=1082868 RepID=A0A2S5R6W8_9PROT|nr:hypothetical protein HCUR_01537 [Holospora curviuscula]